MTITQKVAAAAVLALTLAGTATTSASAATTTLPTMNTAHHCVRHTTGVCGWNVGVRPANRYETAACYDGSRSYSAHSSGTCSYHRGVRYWFK
ncbi:hypothetical protein CFP65_6385 [Kitasatospora sp. MMS16-BH015]|uniref:DUF3761 domain-containing protein n=1 Tax=Kitasatospora sp. MMS16-BH015 TaxID=2018025 RepID=UPI000CA1EFB2|nr:hypothetical protein [Kitasatospora sp. MMS16-BH015]AUG81041.1 hypothetical protein CFP65_6385 [Kitasatospora sp. MMS16-BH015]